MQTSYTHLSWSKLACASGASSSKCSSKAELCLLVVELQQFTVDLITVFVRDSAGGEGICSFVELLFYL